MCSGSSRGRVQEDCVRVPRLKKHKHVHVSSGLGKFLHNLEYSSRCRTANSNISSLPTNNPQPALPNIVPNQGLWRGSLVAVRRLYVLRKPNRLENNPLASQTSKSQNRESQKRFSVTKHVKRRRSSLTLWNQYTSRPENCHTPAWHVPADQRRLA